LEIPIRPDLYPSPPDRPLTGFKVYGEAQKKKYEGMMPESQWDEIPGLIDREWNEMTIERKLFYEEQAEED